MDWSQHQTGWTDERIDRAKTLLAEGLSYTQIARALGGVTRNGVLGKMHRIGAAATTVRQKAAPRMSAEEVRARHREAEALRRERVRLEKAAELEAAKLEVPVTLGDGTRVTMLTVNDRMCRWPIGDVGAPDFHLCGHKPYEGSPYCAAHTRKARQPHGNSAAAKAIATERQQGSVWR